METVSPFSVTNRLRFARPLRTPVGERRPSKRLMTLSSVFGERVIQRRPPSSLNNSASVTTQVSPVRGLTFYKSMIICTCEATEKAPEGRYYEALDKFSVNSIKSPATEGDRHFMTIVFNRRRPAVSGF